MRTLRLPMALLVATLLCGCAVAPEYDYTAFRQSRPRSILIVPPLNNSPAVDATYSVLSQLTLPLAESGYYVLPVTLVDETFRQNGLSNAADIETVSPAKLRQIFGADAALYVHIKDYGTVYRLLASDSVVTAEGRLVDLRTGGTIWQGEATASSAEQRSSGGGGGGVVGALVSAVITQIVESTSNMSHKMAAVTSSRLLAAGRPSGMLYGPRSPNYDGGLPGQVVMAPASQAVALTPTAVRSSGAVAANAMQLPQSAAACAKATQFGANCTVNADAAGVFALRLQFHDQSVITAQAAQINLLKKTYCTEVAQGGRSGTMVLEDQQHAVESALDCAREGWSGWKPRAAGNVRT